MTALRMGLALGLLAAWPAPALEWEIDGARFALTGQVNLGVLHYHDGEDAGSWVPVDNDIQSSRVRLEATLPGEEWEAVARAEFEYQPRPSSAMSVREPRSTDWTLGRDNIRLLEVAIEREGWGRLWLGQGAMASDGAAEVDLSGTFVAAGSRVHDVAGRQYFRLSDGDFADVRVGEAFDHLDGLGRAVRLRYDTPEVAGFRAMAAYGRDALVGQENDDLVDLAVRYEAQREEAAFAAAAGIGWEAGDRVLAGSLSALHTPSGLSLTFAGGLRDERYGFAKLGWQWDLVRLGRTYLSIDYWRGSDFERDASTSQSWGVAAVQDLAGFDAELWLLLRQYEYADEDGPYQAGRAIFGGVRVHF